ncbi:MAG: hypothetical protein V1696_03965 [Candidatus Jorgensenbacteria bacterium]
MHGELDLGTALAAFVILAVAVSIFLCGFVHLMTRKEPPAKLTHRGTVTMPPEEFRPRGGFVTVKSPCCGAPTYWTDGGIRIEKCSKCHNPVAPPAQYRTTKE